MHVYMHLNNGVRREETDIALVRVELPRCPPPLLPRLPPACLPQDSTTKSDICHEILVVQSGKWT